MEDVMNDVIEAVMPSIEKPIAKRKAPARKAPARKSPSTRGRKKQDVEEDSLFQKVVKSTVGKMLLMLLVPYVTSFGANKVKQKYLEYTTPVKIPNEAEPKFNFDQYRITADDNFSDDDDLITNYPNLPNVGTSCQASNPSNVFEYEVCKDEDNSYIIGM